MTRGEIRVGMQARIVGPRGEIQWNHAGLMDEYIGQVVTIKSLGRAVRIEEDDGRWMWNPEDFDPVVELESVSDEDLESILNL